MPIVPLCAANPLAALESTMGSQGAVSPVVNVRSVVPAASASDNDLFMSAAVTTLLLNGPPTATAFVVVVSAMVNGSVYLIPLPLFGVEPSSV